MPINPEFKTQWRPDHDLGKSYNLTPTQDEDYKPTSKQDALAYVMELALPELVCYDGHPVQAELVADEAGQRFPALFGVEVEPAAEENLPAPLDFFAKRTRPDGSIDWNQVAKDTRYAHPRRKLEETEGLTVVDLRSEIA